jgi:SAM-dependent methyltransferase
MSQPEFDRYAESYQRMHAENIRISGEAPDYFARYKAEHAGRLAAGRLPVNRVLDFGCGIGNATSFLQQCFSGCEVTGTDVSPASLEIAKSRTGPDARFVAVEGDALPFGDRHFGLVFVSCVFHHLEAERHGAALHEIRRVLAPDGVLAIYEHNPWNPLTVRAVESCEFDELAVLIPASRMKMTVTAAGFGRARTQFIVFYPGFLHFMRWSESMLSWLPLGAQYCVSARR